MSDTPAPLADAPQPDHPPLAGIAEPAAPGDAIHHDETIHHEDETREQGHASLADRVSASEDVIRQVLGFLKWMFPAHPVPSFVRDPDSGRLTAGEVAPEIAASVPHEPETDDQHPS